MCGPRAYLHGVLVSGTGLKGGQLRGSGLGWAGRIQEFIFNKGVTAEALGDGHNVRLPQTDSRDWQRKPISAPRPRQEGVVGLVSQDEGFALLLSPGWRS